MPLSFSRETVALDAGRLTSCHTLVLNALWYSLASRAAISCEQMHVRILIVDDQAFVRAYLRTLFACREDWQICGEAADGQDAVLKVAELMPDVVILDLAMPVMNGAQAAKEIRQMASATKIILFSAHEAALFGGQVVADAVVSKSSGNTDLIPTVERLTSQVSQRAIPHSV